MRKDDANKDHETLLATAYHEAGHVVAAYLLQMPIGTVSIVPKYDALGYCMVKMPKWLQPHIISDTRTEAWIQRRVLIALAGHISEEQHTGRPNFSGAHQDNETATELAGYVCFSQEETDAYLKWLGLRAGDLLKTNRAVPAIEAVALALVERGTLRPQDVKTVIQQAIQKAVQAAIEANSRKPIGAT